MALKKIWIFLKFSSKPVLNSSLTCLQTWFDISFKQLVSNWFKPDVHQSQFVVYHVLCSIKVDVKRRQLQIVEVRDRDG